MLSKIDATYIELRERIMLGDLPPGTSMTADDVVAHTGVSLSMARHLLVSLGVGGYLTKRGRAYVVSTFTREQIEEWRLALGAIVEIGALRLTLAGGARLQAVAESLEKDVRSHAVEDEAFFLGAMSFATIILGGRQSTLSELVEQFIPQAFFRLLWLSDIYAERTGFLVEAADSYLVAARAGDLDGVRKASRFFFDSTAPALHKLIEQMERKDFPKSAQYHALQAIEPQVSGLPTYTGSTKAARPLLGPLSDAGAAAHPL